MRVLPGAGHDDETEEDAMTTRLGSALLLSLTLVSTSVMADGRGYDRGHDRGRSHEYSQRDKRDHSARHHRQDRDYRDRSDYRGDRHYYSRHDDRRDRRYDRDYYDGARHYYKGDRLPARYRERVYVVHDWGHYHLHRPPHGHVWVRVGGDYVLMAIATGIIASIILNH